MMRILLADHHTQPLWALKTMLQEQPEFEVIGDATDAESLLSLAKEHLPDLILLDWELPGKTIEELIADLHSLEPKPVVVVMGSKPEYGRLILKAGADVFTSKVDQPDWLIASLKKFDRNPGQT